MRHGFPRAEKGQVIGLLGGSFDPPHAGHVHITQWALKSFGLDRVWWLVSPGNPLKKRGPAPLDRRVAASREVLGGDPRVVVTDIEAKLGTRYTAATLRAMRRAYPGVTFVWLMGADNLAQFHQWKDWDWIMRTVPVGVLGRPGQIVDAGTSPAARRFAFARLSARRAAALPWRAPPAWCLLTGPMLAISSTEIRARGGWHPGEATS